MNLRNLALLMFAIALPGCADSIRLEVEPAEILVKRSADDENPTTKTIVRNSGEDRLKLSRFETDLPPEFKLQWRHVETASGLKRGPELIAGYINGRNLFPKVLDIEVGYEIHLLLSWQGAGPPHPGHIAFKTNVPSTPLLKIPVKVVTP